MTSRQRDKKITDQVYERIGGNTGIEKFAREYLQGPAFSNEKTSPYSKLKDELDMQRIVVPEWHAMNLSRSCVKSIERKQMSEHVGKKNADQVHEVLMEAARELLWQNNGPLLWRHASSVLEVAIKRCIDDGLIKIPRRIISFEPSDDASDDPNTLKGRVIIRYENS